jgi:hypothetical protein
MTKMARNDAAEQTAPAVVIAFPPRAADPHELREAYDRYRAVTGNVAPDTVVTAEVADARATLTRLLLADGWEPPAEVMQRLHQDELLLRPTASAS